MGAMSQSSLEESWSSHVHAAQGAARRLPPSGAHPRVNQVTGCLHGCYLLRNSGSLCRMQDFGADGGPALQMMEPKLKTFLGHVEQQLSITVPPLDVSLALPCVSAVCLCLCLCPALPCPGIVPRPCIQIRACQTLPSVNPSFPVACLCWSSQPKLLLLTANIMEGAGGILFTIGSSTGAWLLVRSTPPRVQH